MSISKIQLKHFVRLFSQLIKPRKIAIIGGYHGGNLGDIALGLSIKNQLIQGHKNTAVLQTIYSLDKLPWRKSKFAILGGGAIGYNDSMVKVYKKYKEDLNHIAVIGVDFNDKFYSKHSIKLLKEALWLSCRNQQQMKILEKLTGRRDITYHPDLAFSLYNKLCEKARQSEKKEKLFLINVVPLYSSLQNGVLLPSLQYRHERPELYENYETLISSYIAGVKALVNHYLERGYRVESIPFTPQDDEMARYIFSENEIIFNSYTDVPKKMLEKMALSECVFATRYHATIFALKTGSNIIPLAYAKKNEELFNELGISNNQYLTANDLANSISVFKRPFKVKKDIISEWEEKVIVSLNQCFEKMVLN